MRLVLLLILFIARCVFADYSFVLDCQDDTFQVVGPNSVAIFHFSLQNTGSSNDVYELSLTVIDSVPGWSASYCFKGVCPPPDSVEYDTVRVGEIDTTITVYVYTTTEEGTEIVRFKVRSQGDPELADSFNLYTQLGTGIEEWEIQNVRTDKVQDLSVYPNPFHSFTVISYSLSNNQLLMTNDSKHVRLGIYDVNGRLVKTLVDGVKDTGYHSVICPMEEFSSGIYFVKMHSEDFTDTKKLIYIR